MSAFKRSHPNVEFDVKWLPYMLNPTLPKKGVNKRVAYERKFGKDRVERMIPYMKKVGEGVGINFSYGGNIANTMDSHRLLEWVAGDVAKQDKLVESLFQLYFEKEGDIGDHASLTAAAVEAGLNKAEVESFLKSGELQEEVEEAILDQHGEVSGVPHFILSTENAQGKQVNAMQFSGAQPPETFLSVFDRLVKKSGGGAAL